VADERRDLRHPPHLPPNPTRPEAREGEGQAEVTDPFIVTLLTGAYLFAWAFERLSS
jgi:hypothetical protein